MKTRSEIIASDAIASIDPEVRVLIRASGTEDHDDIVWVIFSDDGGATRIVFRAKRQDANRVLGLLQVEELREGLVAVRSSGKTKVYWGLLDDSGA